MAIQPVDIHDFLLDDTVTFNPWITVSSNDDSTQIVRLDSATAKRVTGEVVRVRCIKIDMGLIYEIITWLLTCSPKSRLLRDPRSYLGTVNGTVFPYLFLFGPSSESCLPKTIAD